MEHNKFEEGGADARRARAKGEWGKVREKSVKVKSPTKHLKNPWSSNAQQERGGIIGERGT